MYSKIHPRIGHEGPTTPLDGGEWSWHAAATLRTDIMQEARWPAGSVWTVAEYVAHTEI